MKTNEKSLLIKQASRLTTLGAQVELAREKLKRLIESGVPYTDPRMHKALTRFETLEAEWTALEQAHLRLKQQLTERAGD